MFGPKHTLESVARELIEGLEKGEVVLHEKETAAIDFDAFKARIEETIENNRPASNQ